MTPRSPREGGDRNEGVSRPSLASSSSRLLRRRCRRCSVIKQFSFHSVINSKFHISSHLLCCVVHLLDSLFIRSTLICMTRAQAPCALGNKVGLKTYKGGRFRRTKYRVVWKGLCASDELLRSGVAHDVVAMMGVAHDGYVLHSVPRHQSRFLFSSQISRGRPSGRV